MVWSDIRERWKRYTEEADTFIYFGVTVSKEGGTDKDIRRILGHARVAYRYNKLHKIWTSNQLSRRTKLKIFKSNMISVQFQETWKMNKWDEKPLDAFHNKYSRKITKKLWQVKMTNERVRELARMDKISTVIKVRRWNGSGISCYFIQTAMQEQS